MLIYTSGATSETMIRNHILFEKIIYYYVVNYKSNHTYIHTLREDTFQLVSKLCKSVLALLTAFLVQLLIYRFISSRLTIAQMILID